MTSKREKARVKILEEQDRKYEQRQRLTRRDHAGRCGASCRARIPGRCNQLRGGFQVHHLKMRSQGGQDNDANLVLVCRACHQHIHAHPAESYESHLLIHAWEGFTEADVARP